MQVAVEVEQGLADYKAATSKVDRIKEGYGFVAQLLFGSYLYVTTVRRGRCR